MTVEAIAAGGSLLSGIIGGISANRASKRARKSQIEALAETRRQFDKSLELAQPGIDRGNIAGDELLRLLGLAEGGSDIDLTGIPGFDFQTEQGTRALNAARSSGGTSGGALTRDFARFNQGLASDFYRDYANRLANLAGTGQSAALQAGNQAIASGNTGAQILTNIGNTRASGVINQSNAVTGAIDDIFGSLPELFPDIFGGSRA